MRYRLRTLLILLAVGPPLLSWLHWTLAPRAPSPQLIAIAWKMRNFSGGREVPNAAREQYKLDEKNDGSALLIEISIGKRWQRDQVGIWHACP